MSGFEDSAGAIGATTTARSHATVHLKFIEAVTTIAGVTFDVTIRNSTAHTDNHVDPLGPNRKPLDRTINKNDSQFK